MCIQKRFELTLAIIKPHIIKQPHALLNIRDKILNSNFKIVRSNRQCLTLNEAQTFYLEHQEKFFYNRLVSFMTSGSSEFYILSKINAIKDWRSLMGPTKVYKAQFSEPGSIRGCYGISDTRNATHGSDSQESAEREMNIFFPDFKSKEWFENEEILFRTGKIKFIEEKFIHLPINKS